MIFLSVSGVYIAAFVLLSLLFLFCVRWRRAAVAVGSFSDKRRFHSIPFALGSIHKPEKRREEREREERENRYTHAHSPIFIVGRRHLHLHRSIVRDVASEL